MPALVTTDEAKLRLRIDAPDEDSAIDSMLAEAEDIVIGYIKKPDHDWTDQTAPFRIKAAILLVFGGLYEGRGPETELLTEPVRTLLHRDRDPALA